MSRPTIRQMKRALVSGNLPGAKADTVALAEEAALYLLARSISFGHRRLAVVRLALAVRTGAAVPQEHWIYCREAALKSNDDELKKIFLQAAQAQAIGSDSRSKRTDWHQPIEIPVLANNLIVAGVYRCRGNEKPDGPYDVNRINVGRDGVASS